MWVHSALCCAFVQDAWRVPLAGTNTAGTKHPTLGPLLLHVIKVSLNTVFRAWALTASSTKMVRQQRGHPRVRTESVNMALCEPWRAYLATSARILFGSEAQPCL